MRTSWSSVSRGARLSAEASRYLADLVREWMPRVGIHTTYELYLLLDDVSRSALYRWLGGEVRISLSAASEVVAVIAARASSVEQRDVFSRAVEVGGLRTWEARLRLELRARQIPVEGAMEALRAAKMVPEHWSSPSDE